jgi:hypothetical protein
MFVVQEFKSIEQIILIRENHRICGTISDTIKFRKVNLTKRILLFKLYFYEKSAQFNMEKYKMFGASFI